MKRVDDVINQLQECIDILDSVNKDAHSHYELTVIDEHGTRTILETRENYLEFLMNAVSEKLALLMDDIEERENVKSNLKIIK